MIYIKKKNLNKIEREDVMKRTRKYEGSWSANNGSTYNTGYTDNNKRRLAHDMRIIARGNCFRGNSGNWCVYEVINGEREELPILSGTVRNK